MIRDNEMPRAGGTGEGSTATRELCRGAGGSRSYSLKSFADDATPVDPRNGLEIERAEEQPETINAVDVKAK